MQILTWWHNFELFEIEVILQKWNNTFILYCMWKTDSQIINKIVFYSMHCLYVIIQKNIHQRKSALWLPFSLPVFICNNMATFQSKLPRLETRNTFCTEQMKRKDWQVHNWQISTPTALGKRIKWNNRGHFGYIQWTYTPCFLRYRYDTACAQSVEPQTFLWLKFFLFLFRELVSFHAYLFEFRVVSKCLSEVSDSIHSELVAD